MYRKMYKHTQHSISVLGLGCMRFPTKEEDKKTVIDKEKASEIVDYAFKHGINYFDTAYMYHDGLSEDFVGEALSKYDRDSFYLATKLPIWMAKDKEDMERIFNDQLRKLQVEYFDFYLLHALNKENFNKCEEFGAYEFILQKKKEGKIKNIGFSFHDTPEVLQEIVDSHAWDFAQLQINYLDWKMQDAKRQYEILEENNIPCIVMEPVRGGTLANPCEEANELFKRSRPDKSVASWAIRYVASLPNVMVVLSGMTSLEQMIDNVTTMSDFEPLTVEDYQVVDEAVNAYLRKDSIPCTGCNYCNICPMEVSIPGIFNTYNQALKITKERAFVEGMSEYPDLLNINSCIECGECQTHCPQAIEIPSTLKRLKDLLD